MKDNYIKDSINRRLALVKKLYEDGNIIEDIISVYTKLIQCFQNGNKVMFCGNGGSAADCQHIVGEFVVKLSKWRKSLPVIALTSNSSIITAISNDKDFNSIFVRQIEGIARSGDLLVGISTSGESLNVINAFEYSNKNNIFTISVTGNNNNRLKQLAKEKIVVPTDNTQIIQEMYMMIFHIICEKIEEFYCTIKK